MDPTHLLLVQALSLSGLLGGSGAYAGIVRRRRDRLEERAFSRASEAAVERVDRHMAIARLDHTFMESVYRPIGRRISGRGG